MVTAPPFRFYGTRHGCFRQHRPQRTEATIHVDEEVEHATRIDDEYEDGDQRASTCSTILPIFFTLVYEYHQGGGFLTIAVKKLFSLVQFVFVVAFSTFFTQCVDYEVLFANKNLTTTGEKITGKRSFDVQKHLHLKVDRDNITPFDLYNRILRFKNYLVALVNTVAMYGFLNLIFFPLIFLYQILYAFFTLSELIKRRRDALGMRRYSNYGRYRVRHFNELNHELTARLNRSHVHANAYLNQFTSVLTEILAKNIAFIAGAIAGVLAILSAWDEDVLQ
ncbi:autophagy protein Apg9, partial [Teladorsagia circumcincta]